MRVEPCPHCIYRVVEAGSWDWPECEVCGAPLAINETLFTEGWFSEATEWVYWNEIAEVSNHSRDVTYTGAATRIPNELDLDGLAGGYVKLHDPKLIMLDEDLFVKRSRSK